MKTAVFDLDGTLWKENSHIDILCKYYKTHFWNSILMKVFAKIAPKCHRRFLIYVYEKIPNEYIDGYKPTFRKSAIDLMTKAENEGYSVVIISNAPERIVANAAERLRKQYLCAEPGDKYNVLSNSMKTTHLLVCTDNKVDIDLLDKADKRIIYVTDSTKKFFQKRYKNAEWMYE